MKCQIFILISLFLLFSCNDKIELLKSVENINISFAYTKDPKINGKILLKKDDKRFKILNNLETDATSDTKNVSENENTEDIVVSIGKKEDNSADLNRNRDLYIYKIEEIDLYEKRLKEIEDIFISCFREKFKSENIKINEDNNEDEGNKKDKINIECIILHYNQGEFNRIKNIPTELNILFKISNKDLKIEKKYSKKFVAKSIPELPTERIRLKDIGDRFSLFLYNEFIKIKINKEEVKTKDAKNKESKNNIGGE
ncbi:MAG TPA: hypothetical protein PLE45_05925 [Spirochaetota bacterium]|nr:hypothetical protein [Spirochaetota bacterium]HPP04231.1 hypothetical protein [Spirochaetota bacterium]